MQPTSQEGRLTKYGKYRGVLRNNPQDISLSKDYLIVNKFIQPQQSLLSGNDNVQYK
jgi:hypothetical protein